MTITLIYRSDKSFMRDIFSYSDWISIINSYSNNKQTFNKSINRYFHIAIR